MAVPQTVNPDKNQGKPTTKKQFLNTAEAADFLSVSTDSLARWRMQKTGPTYHRVKGFAVRYRIDDLEAFMQAGRVEHGDK